MKKAELIIQYMKNNHGKATSKQISDQGFSRAHIKYMLEKEMLIKQERGIYTLKGTWEDEMQDLQLRYKRGVYSGETALYLHGVIDRVPIHYQMTFPKSYNVSIVQKREIVCRRTKNENYYLGVTEQKTIYGNYVRTYNLERALCDILDKKNHTDSQILSEAFQSYFASRHCNISLLAEYAKQLRVYHRLQGYLEMFL